MVLMCMQSDNGRTAITDGDIAPTLISSAGARGGYWCCAVDSHPMDSRITLVWGACPTIAAHIAKVGVDGPLILIGKNDDFDRV